MGSQVGWTQGFRLVLACLYLGCCRLARGLPQAVDCPKQVPGGGSKHYFDDPPAPLQVLSANILSMMRQLGAGDNMDPTQLSTTNSDRLSSLVQPSLRLGR